MSQITMRDLRAHTVAKGSVTLWWLGQASWIIKSPGGQILALDPYLSDSCNGLSAEFNMKRQFPAPLSGGELNGIDAYVLTHTHQDHLDPVTLAAYLKAGGRGPFVAPNETAEKLTSLDVSPKDIQTVWPNKVVNFGDVSLRTTFAIPYGGDDLTHVGYLLSVKDGPVVYFTGDTAYHDILRFAVAPHKPDALVTVINGAFRNMGPAEAARLALQLGVKIAIPCHHDLFLDNSLPPQLFHSCLKVEGIGNTYRTPKHGEPFTISKD
jgi:L-ascorbate 6-phosphate lactonase